MLGVISDANKCKYADELRKAETCHVSLHGFQFSFFCSIFIILNIPLNTFWLQIYVTAFLHICMPQTSQMCIRDRSLTHEFNHSLKSPLLERVCKYAFRHFLVNMVLISYLIMTTSSVKNNTSNYMLLSIPIIHTHKHTHTHSLSLSLSLSLSFFLSLYV